MFKVNNKTLKRRTKNIKATSFTFLRVFIGNFQHNSYFLTFIILSYFSSACNAVCKHTPFSLNMYTIMAVTTSTYVNTTVIKTMVATPNNDYS